MKINKVITRSEITSYDFFYIFIITTISLIIRLWIISHPDCPVFDEVHFGNFTNWYTRSEFFFDIHPPLGKLIMFGIAKLSEYEGDLKFNNVKHYSNGSYVFLRIIPAIFSALCSPLIYLTLRFTDFGYLSAITSAVIVMADTSMATEGRFILSDGMLHFFSCLHMAIISYAFRIELLNSRKFNIYHFLTGLSLGAACSCKNTAWGLMAFDAFLYFVRFWPLTNISLIDYLFEVGVYGVTLFIIQFMVYALSFCIHFIVLPYAGQGNGYIPEYMQKQLIPKQAEFGNLWGVRLRPPDLFVRSLTLSWIMHSDNMQIKQFHPSQSRPLNWPFLTGIDVGFWGGGGEEIKCHGNVFSYYMAMIGVILCIFRISYNKYIEGLRFVIGWAVCYFPFYLIPRTMYLYHYLIPFMIGCCAYGAAIDIYLPKKARGLISFLSCTLALFGFWLWMPLVYGKYGHDRDIMYWNQNWLSGDFAYRYEKALGTKTE